jgi:phage tail-like protein
MLRSLKKEIENTPLNIFYTLDIDQTRLAAFDSISGGDVQVSMIRHNVVYESGEYRTLLLPGPTQYQPVTLERGYGNTKELYNWFVEANNGKMRKARRHVTITLHVPEKGEYKALVSWNLLNAFPISISGFDGSQDGRPSVSRFSITIAAEVIERVDP